MKRAGKLIHGGAWRNHYLAARVMLALGSLVSLVLASGAGSHWH